MLTQIENFRKEYEDSALALADALRNQAMPELTEELFLRFELCGNRLDYENAYFGRRKFLSVFGLVCLMKHRAEDVRKLEEVILSVCGEECWALPAHVDRHREDWRITIDLFAAETAQTLAHMVTLFAGELSENVVKTAKKEIYRRVLTPFLTSEAPYAWWETAKTNWNAVCCGNIGSAGMYLICDEREKRRLAERIFKALREGYLAGFGDDGACEEGLGYWAYGFTYFTMCAAQIRKEYPDIDLMAAGKVEKIACFQQKCYFAGGRTISFSDGDCFGSYPMGLTCKLAMEYDSLRFPDAAYAGRIGGDACWRWMGMYMDWYQTGVYIDAVKKGEITAPQPENVSGCTVFSDVQWAVFRGKYDSVVLVKGGHNGEAHNHNDVGSFVYMADGEAFLDDLGAGEYTKDYFSDKRYTIFCNRGMSHNIPIINGIDQRAGREYGADFFSVTGNGEATIEYKSAYAVDGLAGLERKIHFDEETGGLAVTDTARTDGDDVDIDFWENLITRLPVSVENGVVTIHGARSDAVIRLCEAELHIAKPNEAEPHIAKPNEVELRIAEPHEAEPHVTCQDIICSKEFNAAHNGEIETVNVIKWKAEKKLEGLYQASFCVRPKHN